MSGIRFLRVSRKKGGVGKIGRRVASGNVMGCGDQPSVGGDDQQPVAEQFVEACPALEESPGSLRGIKGVGGNEGGAGNEKTLGNAEGIVDFTGNVADQRTLLIDNGLVEFALEIADRNDRHEHGEQNHQRRNGECHSLFEIHYPNPRGCCRSVAKRLQSCVSKPPPWVMAVLIIVGTNQFATLHLNIRIVNYTNYFTACAAAPPPSPDARFLSNSRMRSS